MSDALLERYRLRLAEELAACADRPLLTHLRSMRQLAAQAEGGRFHGLARSDPAGADALLSDLLAVATWAGWELPIGPAEERELPVEGLPRGLLGNDRSSAGAAVWRLGPDRIGLARPRQPGQVDPGHWQGMAADA